MILSFQQFGGIAPALSAELLADNAAQTAQNADLFGHSLRAYNAISTVATPTKVGTKLSIHRFGKDVISDSQYWLTWTTAVSVARSVLADDASERTYFTDDGVPKVTDATLALTSGTDYPVASYTLGVPAPAAAPTPVPASSTAPIEERAYVYTYVTAWGEESAPSPAETCTVTVGSNVTVNDLLTAPAGNYNITSKRIYRSVTTDTGTDFFYVGSVAIATTTFTDNVAAEAIGEPLQTLGWLVPPTNLSGLVAMHSGIYAGFHGKEVCLSEPYAPYAWPLAHRYTVDYDIVGLCPLPQSLLILTKGAPYIITGNEPVSMLKQKVDFDQSCTARRSIAKYGQGCVYASPDGLVYVGVDGSRLLTKGMYRRKEWQLLVPATMHGAIHEDRYFGFYNSAAGFIFDFSSGNFVTLNYYASALHVDPQTDALYLALGADIKKWDTAGTKTPYVWKSKRVLTPAPINFGAAQVICGSYTANPTLKVYADGVLKHTQTVTSSSPFRLPAGFTALKWEVQLEGEVDVFAVHLAETIAELKRVV